MSPWRYFYRRLVTPIRVVHTVPPADVPPAVDISAELRHVAQSALIDMTNRKAAAIRLIDDKLREDIDARRKDDLLDIRNVLDPGSRILPARPPVPVVPGRAS